MFFLQLSTLHFEFPLRTISLLDLKDVNLVGNALPHSTIKGEKGAGLGTSVTVPQFFKNFIFRNLRSGRNL